MLPNSQAEQAGSKNHVQCGVEARWLYIQLSLSYSLQSRRAIFNGNMLDQQGRNYFNVPGQPLSKARCCWGKLCTTEWGHGDMGAFTMFSWRETQRHPSCLAALDISLYPLWTSKWKHRRTCQQLYQVICLRASLCGIGTFQKPQGEQATNPVLGSHWALSRYLLFRRSKKNLATSSEACLYWGSPYWC